MLLGFFGSNLVTFWNVFGRFGDVVGGPVVILGHSWETWDDKGDWGQGSSGGEEAEEILLLHIGEGEEEILANGGATGRAGPP